MMHNDVRDFFFPYWIAWFNLFFCFWNQKYGNVVQNQELLPTQSPILSEESFYIPDLRL